MHALTLMQRPLTIIPMEDHRLRAFCLIVEMKSFSKAAEVKFMTQSAMSHLIRNLEDEIGVRLLHRTGKTITPTPAGRLLYERAKKILDQYKTLESDIYDLVGKIRGDLQLGASATAARYLLPQVFYDFAKTHPEVRINLSVSNSDEIINRVLGGTIDLGIVEGKIRGAALIMEAIAEDEIVLIASDDNPLSRKKQIVLKDLISQPFIMPQEGSGVRELVEEFLNSARIPLQEIHVLMTVGDPELVIQMVQSGLGISFVSKWSTFRALKEGTIMLLPLQGKRILRKFFLIRLEREPSTMVLRTFVEFVRAYRFFVPF